MMGLFRFDTPRNQFVSSLALSAAGVAVLVALGYWIDSRSFPAALEPFAMPFMRRSRPVDAGDHNSCLAVLRLYPNALVCGLRPRLTCSERISERP
jgi:hypothetical protein